MSEFDPARRVREAALVALDSLPTGGPLPADLDFGSLADERGYWLAPLVRTLRALLAGHPGAMEHPPRGGTRFQAGDLA
ncbi:hypothetical protein ABIB25_001345 [Nakamurella sp. UYEF19]|uniref:hypothetical protein n=1 Tax=Nakamurella sp. UYEF19 TaxID=1756392 RepID=UPI00339695B2